MPNTLLVKRSTIPGKVPTAAQLAIAELAVNVADKRIYTKDQAEQVINLSNFVGLIGNEVIAGEKSFADKTLIKSLYCGTAPVMLNLQRTLPTAVNDWIELGNFVVSGGSHSLRVSASASGNISISKQYAFTSGGNVYPTWTEATPILTTGIWGDTDFALDVRQPTGGVFSLRLRRLSGIRTGGVDFRIEYLGRNVVTFNETVGIGSETLTLPKINTITQHVVNKTLIAPDIFSAGTYRVNALNTAPASATAPGVTGEIRYTADFIYVCIATNTWRRTPLATW